MQVSLIRQSTGYDIMYKKAIQPVIKLADILFPSCCAVCGNIISNKDNALCVECRGNVNMIKERCVLCSGTVINGECTICRDRKMYISGNTVISDYEGAMKNILHHYKFKKKRRLSVHLAEMALLEIDGSADKFDIITSVPMNRKKSWDRGFNQSALIAKRLSRRLGKPYLSLLREKSHFKTQKTLGYRERFLNILDRYEIIDKKIIEDRNILIIDDVFTTGATINECARILKSFGADNVYSLTMARANIKRVE